MAATTGAPSAGGGAESQPRQRLRLADTNMALTNSDYARQVRQANAESAAEWTNAGQTVGVEMWRIEKFQVKKYELDHFYDGDAFIVLHSQGTAGSAPTAWDAYFWLGSFCSQDEAGAAAIKIIELDDLLGGSPTQHRETQGAETEPFLALFGGNLHVNEGGVASGFTKMRPREIPRRLFQLRSSGGIRSTKSYQRPCALSSLNEDDTFVLDMGGDGRTLYVFQGRTCSPGERMLASNTAQKLADSRGTGVRVQVVTTEDAPADFWAALGSPGFENTVAEGRSTIPAQPPAEQPAQSRRKTLLRISDSTGTLQTTKVMENEVIPLSQFDTNDAFILDAGLELFVWIGKRVSPDEKINAMPLAQQYLNSCGPNRDLATPITRVMEGVETAFFKTLVQGEQMIAPEGAAAGGGASAGKK